LEANPTIKPLTGEPLPDDPVIDDPLTHKDPITGRDHITNRKSYLLGKGQLVHIISGISLLIYAYFFWKNLSRYWFNPHWTTDDALQQTFPFHAVYHPEIFKNDLIAKTMTGYLTPIHYWLSYLITYWTRDPIMTGHWVMLIQLASAALFLF